MKQLKKIQRKTVFTYKSVKRESLKCSETTQDTTTIFTTGGGTTGINAPRK